MQLVTFSFLGKPLKWARLSEINFLQMFFVSQIWICSLLLAEKSQNRLERPCLCHALFLLVEMQLYFGLRSVICVFHAASECSRLRIPAATSVLGGKEGSCSLGFLENIVKMGLTHVVKMRCTHTDD